MSRYQLLTSPGNVLTLGIEADDDGNALDVAAGMVENHEQAHAHEEPRLVAYSVSRESGEVFHRGLAVTIDGVTELEDAGAILDECARLRASTVMPGPRRNSYLFRLLAGARDDAISAYDEWAAMGYSLDYAESQALDIDEQSGESRTLTPFGVYKDVDGSLVGIGILGSVYSGEEGELVRHGFVAGDLLDWFERGDEEWSTLVSLVDYLIIKQGYEDMDPDGEAGQDRTAVALAIADMEREGVLPADCPRDLRHLDRMSLLSAAAHLYAGDAHASLEDVYRRAEDALERANELRFEASAGRLLVDHLGKARAGE